MRCSWVSSQSAEHGGELWISGVEDYLTHARGLLAEFGDVIAAASAGAHPSRLRLGISQGLGLRTGAHPSGLRA